MRISIKSLFVVVLSLLIVVAFLPQHTFAATGIVKSKAVVTEGNSVTLTLKGFKKKPYAHISKGLATCKVISKSKVRITAVKAGYAEVTVRKTKKSYPDYCTIIIMPKNQFNGVTAEAIDGGTRLTYQDLQFDLPEYWNKNNYITIDCGNCLELCSKSDYKDGYGGQVFTIAKSTEDEYEIMSENVDATELGEKGDDVYYIYPPSDVRFNDNKLPKSQEKYDALAEALDTIIDTAVIL